MNKKITNSPLHGHFVSLITILIGLIVVMENVSSMKAKIIDKAENNMLETTIYRDKNKKMI